MKILHIITDLDVGGAETALYRVASGMDPARFQSRVVSLMEPGPVGSLLTHAGIPVDHLSMRRSRPSLAGLLRLIRIIREWRPDVIQTWLYHADLLGLGAARLARSKARLAWNLRCSHMDLDKYSAMTAWTLKACTALSGQPDAIVSNSEDARDHHRTMGYKPNRYVVIPNGFDTDIFRPDPQARAAFRAELNLEDGQPLIGMVARYDPMKDVPTFLRAMELVRQHHNVAVAMIGQGMNAANGELAAAIGRHHLGSCCRLLGRRENIHTLLPGLDLMVSSSCGESFPNVLGEAMACGVPCVATDVGDSARLVGACGTTVPPGDAPALAQAVSDILTASNMAALGRCARQRIQDHYTLSMAINGYTQLYEGLQNGFVLPNDPGR